MEMGNLLYELNTTEEPLELLYIWGRYNELTKDYKLIVTPEKYNKDAIYPLGIVDILDKKGTDFVAYFRSEKILFLDTNILQTMLQNPSAQIQYDYSIMLDTNYTSYIRTFLKRYNESNFSQESVYLTLDYLLRKDFNYDYTFYLMENYKNLFLAGEKSFTISNPHHLKVYENLYYLELFKSINHQKYLEEKKIEFLISTNEARQNTDQMIDIFYKNKYKDMLGMFVDLHANITLLLIGIWKIKFSSKASAKNKMNKLLDFVINEVGIIFERELIIAFKYFEDGKSVSMLNKVNKGGNSKELLKKIENIAWDFLVPRVMEVQISIHKEKSYYIPFFLSHDKALKELMELFKIKGILIHNQTNEYIPFSELNTTEFFKEKGLIEEFGRLNNVEVKEKRAMIRQRNKDTNFEAIGIEIEKLIQVLNS
ncbi:hypothetical protein [Priestia taiwanensis]|uniref:Uncharacterized protein n=1 Tax=Priestia taiwanensis TaxID=1347902 RepID=A0A917AY23_9BACI|nr:hypothetical protein [Priestia taiwanensis]MBM7364786.1 hypothetical protein [Priestia taiwanensis]GGE79596.1 hypothetical protein GCM10007140_31500 [Priestia taiwanensis]